MQTRRNLLGTIGVAGVTGLAGCGVLDSGSEEGTEATPTGEEDGDADAGTWLSLNADAGNTSSNTAMSGPTSEPAAETLYEPEGFTDLSSTPIVEDGQLFLTAEEKLLSLSMDGEKNWEFGRGSSFSVDELAPAVRDGTVYLPTGSSLAAVSDGERQWAASLSASPETNPITTGDAVYIASRSELISYAHDGTERWRQELDQGIGQLSVDGSTLYHSGSAVLGNRKLYARSVSDGSVQWEAEEVGTSATPVVADGTVFSYQSDFDGARLVAVSGSDGSELWETDQLTGSPVGQPAIADGTVYLATGEEVQAFDADDGSPQWDAPYVTTGTVTTVPRVDANSVYLYTDSTVSAVDRATGEQRWSNTLGDGGYFGFRGLSAAAGSIYVTTTSELFELS